MRFLLKVVVSALVLSGASELARRSTFVGAVLISLPLSSVMALVWLWRDTGDVEKVAAFSWDIFLMVVPSLLLFIVFPWFLRMGWRFEFALGAACAVMVAGYWAYVAGLRAFGVGV
jgi:hypothetical protein